LAALTARAIRADLFLPERLKDRHPVKGAFSSLGEALRANFGLYQGHVVTAATGLTVRLIAPLAASKRTDPAVVTMGQDGRFVVSLLSGHLGRANDLARMVAGVTGGQAVITTATDLERVPALEVLAADLGLRAPDLGPLPPVSRSLCEGRPIPVHDPFSWLWPSLTAWPGLFRRLDRPPENGPSVSVDHRILPLPPGCLVLRPPALAIGLGCHRDCPVEELTCLVDRTLEEDGLSADSAALLATIEARGLPGLAPALAAARWRLPLLTYSPAELSSVEAPNPSETVLRRIGVASVCEASARLAARMGPLIVSKRKSARATCAAALISSRS
jgi:cobalt-precorrin 5A hydrolase